MSGRFKKCFRPVKTGQYFQAIYRWLKKVAPKNTRLRIFSQFFVSIDYCNNISWTCTCTCTRHNLLRKKSISRNLSSSFLTKAWGEPRGNLLNKTNFKPVKTAKNRPVQSFQPIRSGRTGSNSAGSSIFEYDNFSNDFSFSILDIYNESDLR
jgi:hypothetical protein